MKKVFLILSLFSASITISLAQENEITGVKIGKQTWSEVNLSVTTFRNGDPILLVTNEDDWVKAAEEGKPACANFDFDSMLGELSGLLYNWYAVTDKRGLAPKGWHVPTDAEWTELTNAVGGKEAATLKLKSEMGWAEGSEGTNESNFDGMPGGKIDQDGIFDEYGSSGYWWSSSEAEGFGLNRNLSAENYPFETAQAFKGYGFSVRLVKD